MLQNAVKLDNVNKWTKFENISDVQIAVQEFILKTALFLSPHQRNFNSKSLFTSSDCYKNWYADWLVYEKHIWSSYLTL